MASYRAEAQRAWKVAAFAAILLSVLRPAATAEEERTRKAVLDIGREEFQESCAACHGADASGRGELANKLMKRPKDLTMIADRVARYDVEYSPEWKSASVLLSR